MEDILAAKGEEFANPQGADNSEELAQPFEAGAVNNSVSEKTEGLTQNVARRIKEERQRAKDQFVAEVFGSNQEFQLFLAEKEKKTEEEEHLQSEAMANYRQLEEAYTKMTLASDPVTGEVFKTWQKEVEELSQELEIEDEAAFLFLLGKRLPDILAKEREKTEQEVLEKILANQNSPGPLSGGQEEFSLSSLNDKQFALLLEKVKMGEIDKI